VSTPGVVLITGATSGLGRYLATEVHRRGWTVLAHGRNPAKLAELAGELGGDTRTYLADLASLTEVRRLAARVLDDEPRLDVLVNNAAVGFGPPHGKRESSPDGHELRFAVNYLAPVLLARSLLPLLTKSAPARVVNVGSIGQLEFDVDDLGFHHAYSGVAAYRRSKLALVTETFQLAEELAGSGVVANCVHPAGFMDTAMVRESGVSPLSAVEDGGRAVTRLVTDPALDEFTGQFLSGTTVTKALQKAYDPKFRRALRDATDRLLAEPSRSRDSSDVSANRQGK
jgi:NAD(P)-dependent dehydrogenase (short-subunit alcohol dehydrogenase family)